jgi:hypothetical protein
MFIVEDGRGLAYGYSAGIGWRGILSHGYHEAGDVGIGGIVCGRFGFGVLDEAGAVLKEPHLVYECDK